MVMTGGCFMALLYPHYHGEKTHNEAPGFCGAADVADADAVLRMLPLAWYIRRKGLLARMKPRTTCAGVAFACSWDLPSGKTSKWLWEITSF